MTAGVLARIREKAGQGRYRLTSHAQLERFADRLTVDALEAVLLEGDIVEDYPDDLRGHSCLMLGLSDGTAIHVVVGGLEDEAQDLVIITVYLPDPRQWEADWRTRRRLEA